MFFRKRQKPDFESNNLNSTRRFSYSIEDNDRWAKSSLYIAEFKDKNRFYTLASSSLDFLTFFAPFFFPPDLQAKQIPINNKTASI